MHTLSIDYETFSGENIKKVGLYKYLECPLFEITLITYKLNNDRKKTIDLSELGWTPDREDLIQHFIFMLLSPDYLKTSHNAAFEVGASERQWGITCDLKQWECTQIRAAYMGWPLALDALAKAMKLPVMKMTEGKRLIAFFCCPVKPTKVNGGKTRNMPEDYPVKWKKFIEYNRGDVDVENAVRDNLEGWYVPAMEWELWRMDQKINRRGVNVNMELVRKVMEIDQIHKASLIGEARDLTDMENPNGLDQIKAWILERTSVEIESLKKENIEGLIEQFANFPEVVEMLELRGDMSKTSIRKYQAISMAVCADGRLRGLIQHYGANRTGRSAGRLTQVHNLVRNDLDSKSDPNALDRARNIVLSDMDVEDKIYLIGLLYGSVPDVLSKLIRTAFIPSKGNTLIVSDLASIEARVLAYLAGEEWKLQVFRTHGKIYEATASQMFGVPIEAVTKDSEYRRKSKISELALGFNGGPDAMIKMGAIKMGMVESELPKTVKMWRNANPQICRYWTRVNNAALLALKNPGKLFKISKLDDESATFDNKGISIEVKGGYMLVHLPSGRHLSYVRPRIIENRFGGEGIGYDGMNQTSKLWQQQETYGGKLVENIVQAIARDILFCGMRLLEHNSFDIVLHVHDESVIDDGPLREDSAEDYFPNQRLTYVREWMRKEIDWAPGLPLGAEGFVSEYYKKD